MRSNRYSVRMVCRALVVALIATLWLPAVARAQQEQPPLEDVTLRGRILRPDGSPLANTDVRVDAKEGFSFFGVFAFVFTGGLSALSCFGGPSELCPASGGKSYFGTTDANGRYSFTFPDAKRRGEQTNTDYFLSVGMPSAHRPGGVVVALYELELLDPVHDAPDLRIWDPAARIKPHARSFELDFERRPQSAHSIDVRVGDRETAIHAPGGMIDARAIEDVSVQLVPRANEDVTSKGTIYHQRFVAASTPLKGPLVPLSRGAPCVVKRTDGSTVPGCGYTDGDLVTPSVADRNPCTEMPPGFEFRPNEPCEAPVSEVTIDLGVTKSVGDVRTRCGCIAQGSTDGVTWRNIAADGDFGSGQSLRYVRVSSESSALGPTAEISAWPPWPDQTTQLADEPGTTPLAPYSSGDDDGVSARWLALLALAVLAGVGALFAERLRRARRDGIPFA